MGTSSFRRLAAAHGLGAAGDALVAVSLAGTLFFSVPLGEARSRVALYLLVAMAPYAVVAPVVGPLLARFSGSSRIAIVVAAALRGAAAFFMSTRTDRLLLYPLAFTVLVLSRTHAVSKASLLPSVTERRRTLIAANGTLAVVSVLSAAAAVPPGLLLGRWFSAGATLRLAALVYVVGGLAGALIPGSGEPLRRRETAGRLRLPPEPVRGGLAVSASRAALGFLLFFLAFHFRAQESSPAAVGAALAMAGAGAFVSALAAPLLTAGRERFLIVGGPGALALFAVVAAFNADIVASLAVAGVAGVTTSAARLGFDSIMQEQADDEGRARAFARYETLFQLWWVGGAGLATAVPFGPAPGFVTVAVLAAAGSVLAVRGPVAPGTLRTFLERLRSRRGRPRSESARRDG